MVSHAHESRAWVLPYEDATAIVQLDGEPVVRSRALACPLDASWALDLEGDTFAWACDERVFVSRGQLARDVAYLSPLAAPGPVRALALHDSVLFALTAARNAALVCWDLQAKQPSPVVLVASLDPWWSAARHAPCWMSLEGEQLWIVGASGDESGAASVVLSQLTLTDRTRVRVGERRALAEIDGSADELLFARNHDRLWVLAQGDRQGVLRGLDLRTFEPRAERRFPLLERAQRLDRLRRGVDPVCIQQLVVRDERALLRCPSLGVASLDLRALAAPTSEPLPWSEPFEGSILSVALASASDAIVSYERRPGAAKLARWSPSQP